MKPRLLLSSPAFFLLLLVAPRALAQESDPAARFPASTFAYAEVDAGAIAREAPRLGIARALADKDLRTFFQPLLDRLHADPEDPVESLLKRVRLEDWIAGKAAIGVYGFEVDLSMPRSPPVHIAMGPDHPFDLDDATKLLGSVFSAGLRGYRMPDEYSAHLDVVASLEPGELLKRKVGDLLDEIGVRRSPVPGEGIERLDFPEEWGVGTLFASLDGKRWYLASDESVLKAAMQGGGKASLAATSAFGDCKARLTNGVPFLFAYLDGRRLAEVGRELLPPLVVHALDRTGLSSVRGAGLGASFVEGGVHESLGFLFGGGRKGALELLDAMPTGFAPLRNPPDGLFAFAGLRFDAAKFWRRLQEIVSSGAAGGGEALREVVDRGVRARTHLDLEKDLLAAFGDEATLSASATMQLIPSFRARLAIRDSAEAKRLLDLLAHALQRDHAPAQLVPAQFGKDSGYRIKLETPFLNPVAILRKDALVVASSAADAAPSEGKSLPGVLQQVLTGLAAGPAGGSYSALFCLDLRSILPRVLPLAGKLPGASRWVDASDLSLVPEKLPRYLTGVGVGLRNDEKGLTIDTFSPFGLLLPALALAVERELATACTQPADDLEELYLAVLRRPDAPYLGLLALSSQGEGVTVQVIAAKTPAAKAGLKKGDRIVEAGGHAVRTLCDFHRALVGCRPGAKLVLKVMRNGSEVTVPVVPEKRGASR